MGFSPLPGRVEKMSIRFDRIPDNRVLSERITSQISDAIINGELKPGDRLPPERELAEQFGVSRTVVRDAIKMLSGRGVLQVRREAGIFVATAEETAMGRLGQLANVLPLQGAGLRDLFDVRKVLEAQGAEWAAQRRSAHHVERLRSIVEDAHRHAEDLNVLSERDAQMNGGGGFGNAAFLINDGDDVSHIYLPQYQSIMILSIGAFGRRESSKYCNIAVSR